MRRSQGSTQIYNKKTNKTNKQTHTQNNKYTFKKTRGNAWHVSRYLLKHRRIFGHGVLTASLVSSPSHPPDGISWQPRCKIKSLKTSVLTNVRVVGVKTHEIPGVGLSFVWVFGVKLTEHNDRAQRPVGWAPYPAHQPTRDMFKALMPVWRYGQDRVGLVRSSRGSFSPSCRTSNMDEE